MKRSLRVFAVLVCGLVLAACSDSSNNSTELSVLHAVSDAPRVNVTQNGNPLLSEVDYKAGGQTRLNPGSYDYAVDAILPGGDTLTVIGPLAVTIEENREYVAAAVGTVAADNLELLAYEREGDVSSGQVRVLVGHLASLAPQVDVYVTAPGVDLTTVAEPLATLSYKESAGPVEVPPGDYQIRVTATGDLTPVFDSGPVTLTEGKDLFVGAVDNTNFGDSPISLLVEDEGEVTELVDIDAGAGMRAVHNSYDAPNVDIYVNDGATAAATNLAFPNSFPGSGNAPAEYAALEGGDNKITVTATGSPITSPAAEETFDLESGFAYTVLASNAVANLELLPYLDDNRAIATAARLRVIHGAAQAPNVDVYLVEREASGIGNAEPVP